MSKKIINIGLLGCGTVGQEVYRVIAGEQAFLQSKIDHTLQIKSVCVKDLHKDRGVDNTLLTTDYLSVVKDPAIDIVVELMGDCPEALDAMKTALAHKKSVVTANKAILAKHGKELFDLAKENGVALLFEASVAGSIPILRVLREGLAANQIESLYGIINGTSNYILTKMTQEGAEYEAALKEAQELGYAELNPEADVLGHDAASKLCLLVLMCRGTFLSVEDVFCRGIYYLKPIDFEMAEKFGFVIKLLGIYKKLGQEFEARVHPTMIPKHNPLAHVHGAHNALEYHGSLSGTGMMYGLGAGGAPTASAVVGDIIELARSQGVQNKVALDPAGFLSATLTQGKPKDILELTTRYYIRFSVLDQPNVLARITTVLGKNNISVQHLFQHGKEVDQTIPLIVFTHECCERDVRNALREIDRMEFITQTTKIIRIEE